MIQAQKNVDKWISTFVYEKHLCGGILKEGGIILRVNIYIETDNGSRKKMYRGYGALVEFYKKNGQPETRETYGCCYGTWNLAYITALKDGLGLLTKPCTVAISASNKYVCESLCNGRVKEWQKNGWYTIKGQPIANTDEWRELLKVAAGHEFEFMYHSKSSYSSYMQNKIKSAKNQNGNWQQTQIIG